jgi:hypothetical protein
MAAQAVTHGFIWIMGSAISCRGDRIFEVVPRLLYAPSPDRTGRPAMDQASNPPTIFDTGANP